MITEDIKYLLKAAKAYYVDNKPIMSDREYDKLYQKVRKWEEDNLIPERECLTNKVCLGYFEGSKTEKIPHIYPMLSVENANSRIVDKPVVITPKIDGVAVELIYVNGELYQQLTRGDGYYGSDITKFSIHNVPSYINAEGTIVIRGEVHCPTYKEYGKSHRNVVAGLLGRVDFEIDRGLYFVPYWTSLSDVYSTYESELEWLKDKGFSPIPYVLCTTQPNLNNNFIPNLPYPIDGYVLRYNDNSLYGDRTSHHYKGIWCWKCSTELGETIIKDVEWSKSKNGIWTPVAILEPIELDESTISRINLMSLDYIAEKDVCIGDTVLIHKARGIIPEIVRVVDRPKDREYIYLDSCPTCGADLIQDGIYLKCEDPGCSINQYISYFCNVLGIKGLAIKSIEKLNLEHPLNLYKLTQEYLEDVLGANGKKIYKEIQNSIKAPLVKLLAALNCPKAKENTFTKIFNEFPSIEVLGNMEKLQEVSGIGEKKALAISTWYVDKFLPLIPILLEIGFDLTYHTSEVNLVIAVTGTFPMKRNEFKEMMLKKGIEVKNLTKTSKLLVTGDKASQSKIDKAIKYGIPVVTYYKFIKDLNGLK